MCLEYFKRKDSSQTEQFTIKSRKGVDLCPKGIKESEKRGLFFVIHNHPSNNPLHSEGDIMGFAEYGIKYNVVFTEKRGLLILKNEGADEFTVKNSWNKIYGIMKERFIKKYHDVYKKEETMYLSGYNSRSKFKGNIKNKVIEYMSDNVEETLGVYYECMIESKIDISLISP